MRAKILAILLFAAILSPGGLFAQSPATGTASPAPASHQPEGAPAESPRPSPAAAARGPTLEAPRGAKQGEALALRLRYPSELGAVTAKLILPGADGRPEREISSAKGMPRRMASGESASLVFLLVPLGTAPGGYRVAVSAAADGKPFAGESALSVAKREAPFMEIKLTPELTGIKASPDPRKDEESREITALLCSADSGADFIYGPFIRPLREKAVTSTFGDARRYRYASGGSSESIHLGLDLYADAGTPVAASGRGRVVMAKDRIVTGKTVVIEHEPGLYGLYYHMERIDVAVGEVVEAGAIIGAVGSTGLATGPHLHWELRIGVEAVDPECLVDDPALAGLAPP
jgi:murein DD-endopeptidase MepM/ murein hydrolase activator NlpD